MRYQSDSITPHETWLDPNSFELCIFCKLYFDFVLTPEFKYKALVGVLSSSFWVLLPRPDFPGSRGVKKHYQLVLFWAHTLQSFFLISWRMQTLQRFLCTWTPQMKGQNVLRLNSQISQDGTFVHLIRFSIEHTFIYFTVKPVLSGHPLLSGQ